MGQIIDAAAGFDRSWSTTLRDSDGNPTPYPPDATFDASAWRGGDEASLFAPAVSWVDPAAGTLKMFIAASQTATLEAGEYRLQIGVSEAGIRSLAFDGTLRLGDAPGSTVAEVPWCSYQDMLSRCDQIRTLQARGVDTTGFLNERAIATADRRRMILDRYKPQPGRVFVRQNTMDPIAGQDVPSTTAVPPGKAALTTALTTPGGLILESTIREIVARDAIALVLMRQATGNTAPAYMNEAQMQSDRADRLFRCYKAQIDLDIDGTADVLIDRDAILLPPGTSP